MYLTQVQCKILNSSLTDNPHNAETLYKVNIPVGESVSDNIYKSVKDALDRIGTENNEIGKVKLNNLTCASLGFTTGLCNVAKRLTSRQSIFAQFLFQCQALLWTRRGSQQTQLSHINPLSLSTVEPVPRGIVI